MYLQSIHLTRLVSRLITVKSLQSEWRITELFSAECGASLNSSRVATAELNVYPYIIPGCVAAAQLHMFPVFHTIQAWLGQGWGPLSHSNGCNLIHNQGFTHIIAITVSCHRSDVCRIPRKCRYLVHTLYTAAGGGEIFKTMLLFQADI